MCDISATILFWKNCVYCSAVWNYKELMSSFECSWEQAGRVSGPSLQLSWCHKLSLIRANQVKGWIKHLPQDMKCESVYRFTLSFVQIIFLQPEISNRYDSGIFKSGRQNLGKLFWVLNHNTQNCFFNFIRKDTL